MKKLLLLTIVMLFGASLAFGQAGSIGLFADTGASGCSLVDPFFMAQSVYVIHVFTPGATASEFMVAQSGGFNMIFTGEIQHQPTSIGSVMTGISIGYGGCFAGPILRVTMNYLGQGLSAPCSYLQVVPHPMNQSGAIEMVDCGFVKRPATGGRLIVNPNATCQCSVPTQETTWGKVKALYAQ